MAFYPATAEVKERIERLELPFNRHGLDPFGISKPHLSSFYSLMGMFYRSYFDVRSYGVDHVPDSGRAMIIGNHSGGLPIDAGMVVASLFFDNEPPRHAHGMVEYFAQQWPVVSSWFSRLGHLPGLPEHAIRFLEAERLVMAFPEGVRGTGKLYRDRYKLARFGSGFVRIALQTGAPIVPLAFIGGEEAVPTIFHLKRLAKVIGAPYIPITPYIVPIPKPVKCEIHYGAPIRLKGTGDETDEVIAAHVDTVRTAIADLIEQGRESRRMRLAPTASP